jgi:hypothetical protein
MRRRLLVLPTVLAGLALAAPAARADVGQFISGEPIDGPGTGIQRVGGIDVARDGTGALTYVKEVGGADHVFTSRLINGAWQPPEQLDAGLAGPSSQPVVAGADGGRLVYAFSSGGAVFTAVRGGTDSPTSGPAIVSAGTNPSVDLSINNVAFVSFSAGSDVMVARKGAETGAFSLIGAALDVDPTRPAGVGTGRSRVAVGADGVAIVVWGEAGRVFARKVFEGRLSDAPQDLTLDSAGAIPASGPADEPDIDMEDDSSFAWAVFREPFADGAGSAGGRVIARRLLGSTFDPPVAADGFPTPAPAATGEPRVDINGRGEGYVASAAGSGLAIGSVIKDDKLNPGVGLGGAVPGATFPAPAVDENGDGAIAWQAADGNIHVRSYTNRRASRVVQGPGPEVLWSNPALGATDASLGLEAAADRAGDIAAVWTQGVGTGRLLVAGTFDRAPGAFRPLSGTSFRNVASAATALKWSTAFELWGPLTYSVQVDGRVVATTAQTSAAIPGLADGVHRWRVVATDRRGQTTATAPRVLRQDGTLPRATVSVSGTRRRGRPIRVSVRATDASRTGRRASGIGRVRIAWGDGSRTDARRARHSYRRSGRFALSVSVRDRAGNAVVVRRSLTIR